MLAVLLEAITTPAVQPRQMAEPCGRSMAAAIWPHESVSFTSTPLSVPEARSNRTLPKNAWVASALSATYGEVKSYCAWTAPLAGSIRST
jgi:hypothetical protein